MKKPNYITDLDFDLLKKKYKHLFLIKGYLKREYPVQYLIGNVDFYGYKIKVNKHTLIPRFETEQLIEHTTELINKYNMKNSNTLDIGTGSGCISVVLKSIIPTLTITAIDKSSRALKVAKTNAKLNHVDINFIHESIFKFKPLNKYDIVISNPPYLSKSDIVDKKIKYEPHKALYAKNNGLEFYDYILNNIKPYLNKKFLIAFEIGETQANYIKTLAKKNFKESKIIVKKDLCERDRFIFIINE